MRLARRVDRPYYVQNERRKRDGPLDGRVEWTRQNKIMKKNTSEELDERVTPGESWTPVGC